MDQCELKVLHFQLRFLHVFKSGWKIGRYLSCKCSHRFTCSSVPEQIGRVQCRMLVKLVHIRSVVLLLNSHSRAFILTSWPSDFVSGYSSVCESSFFCQVFGVVFVPRSYIAQNVALRSPSVQSSQTSEIWFDQSGIFMDSPDPAAARAVDGNRDPAQASTCTATKSESGPWWMVDLQNEYKIEAIAITSWDFNQTTLDGVEIWLGISKLFNDSQNIRCAVISSFPKKRTLYVPCGGLKGRYVTVFLPGDSRGLSLCEVEVYPVQFGTTLTSALSTTSLFLKLGHFEDMFSVF
ncbi:unnamed protein product [Tetraodon nigroviridis]|uniref:(spotted green pufferfish) hypothetical protein n=1 Tax=Tetraodon nigroviridis TaxID=99883 RepID=Q4SQR7_TETNG|nr:unnamed protein product [Tetraodon nigroviridis]